MKLIITFSLILMAGLSFGQSKSKETNVVATDPKQNKTRDTSNTKPPTSPTVIADTDSSSKLVNMKNESSDIQPKTPAKKNPNPYILPK